MIFKTIAHREDISKQSYFTKNKFSNGVENLVSCALDKLSTIRGSAITQHLWWSSGEASAANLNKRNKYQKKMKKWLQIEIQSSLPRIKFDYILVFYHFAVLLSITCMFWVLILPFLMLNMIMNIECKQNLNSVR